MTILQLQLQQRQHAMAMAHGKISILMAAITIGAHVGDTQYGVTAMILKLVGDLLLNGG